MSTPDGTWSSHERGSESGLSEQGAESLEVVNSHVYLTKSDMVTDALRDMIMSGKLTSGTSLRQREMTRVFKVSATPIREAFRRLESEGLLTSSNHNGVTVAGTEAEQQEENYRILAALESLAGSMATGKITDSDLADIERLYHLHASCDASDPLLSEMNRQFHFRIYQCADSPILLSLMRLLWRSFPRGPQAGRPHDQSVRQHRTIVDALEQRDEELVVTSIRAHVLGSIDYLHSEVINPDADGETGSSGQ
jgi:DNA-binding GntR family transcriptional regulator